MSFTGASTGASEEYTRSLSLMDGQDGPRAIVKHSEDSAAFTFSNSLVTLAAPTSTSLGSSSGTVIPNLDAYTPLKEHMGEFPAYFDSSIPEDDRLKWAMDNLPKDLVQFEEKRLKFEEDRERWMNEMEALKAKRLLALRREVVHLWMEQEEESWRVSRDSWVMQKKTLEGMLEEDLNNLRIREGSNLQNGVGNYTGGGGALPRATKTVSLTSYASVKR